MKKILFILFILLIVSPLVNATGELVLNPGNKTLTKNFNTNESFDIIFTNNFTSDMFNITLLGNTVAEMSPIERLNQGQSTTQHIRVFGNQDGTYDLRFSFLYQDTVPNNNPQTRNVNVFFNATNGQYQVSPCTFSITKGDSVDWFNQLSSDVSMRSYPSNTPIDGSQITSNGHYNRLFSESVVFSYYFVIGSFPIGPICTINVLNDTGIILDPNLDGIFSLSLNVSLPLTSLEVTIPVTSYNITFDARPEGVISLRNTGNNVARNIRLEGEWFSFSPNGFDLQPGETRGIIYTIIPSITETNQTDRTYSKDIRIMGNFDAIQRAISIYIQPAFFSGSGSNLNQTQILEEICRLFPTSIICKQDPIIQYVANTTDPSASFNITQGQMNDLLLSIYTQKDSLQTGLNYFKDNNNLQTVYQNETAARLSRLEEEQQLRNEKNDKTLNGIYITIATFAFVFIATITGGAIYFIIQRRRVETLRRA